jgi:hypothetical protein
MRDRGAPEASAQLARKKIQSRWGASDPERSRKYAAELVALPPDVILAVAGATTGPLLNDGWREKANATPADAAL